MRKGLVPALAIVSGLSITVLNTVALAEREAWFYMVIGGLMPPLLGLGQWWAFRRRGGQSREVADSMIWTIMLAVVALGAIVRT